jgi:hypothetical protein
MSVTMATAITAVRERLEESTAAQWTDTELTRWINEARREIARKAETYELEASLAITAEVQDKAAPTDLLRIHRAAFHPTGESTVYKLEPRSLHALDAIGMTQLHITTQYPQFYALMLRPAMTIRMYPKPSVAGTLKIIYYAVPADVTTGTLTDLPEGWHDLVYDYCEWRAMRRGRDPRAAEAKDQFYTNLDTMIALTRIPHDQPLDIVTAQGGRGWAGVYGDYDESWGW